MLPEKLLAYGVWDGAVLPSYLTDGDQAWIGRLWEEIDRFAGRRRGDLDEHLAAHETPDVARRARAGAQALLLRLVAGRVDAPADPTELRARVFASAAAAPREAVLAAVASQLGATAAQVERALYADLPEERIVVLPPDPPSPVALVRRYNLALAQGFLLRAERVWVDVAGDARSAIGHARARGLLCVATHARDRAGATIEISGPLSLFRRTTLYGRALASFLAPLAATVDWRLEADCVVHDRAVRFRASARDPLGSDRTPPARFDSAVERALFRDFRRLDSPWEIFRETEPLEAGRRLFFPDFTLVRGDDPSRRAYVEIVGFWTPEYLEAKRQTVRAMGSAAPLVLCVDARLGCGHGDFPGAEIVTFRRRVDPRAVLEALARMDGAALPQL
ncbi:MAG: DUF790 family protein [Myxococcota bacterium]